MYKNIDKIKNHFEKIEKENKFIIEKNIPSEKFNKFKKILLESFKKYPVIIKGSRALDLQLYKNNIYNEEEQKYSDYDIYCYDIEKTMTNIANYLYTHGITEISWRMNTFKPDIIRLLYFGIPIVDADDLNKKLFDIMPIVKDNNINYIDSSFQKIDMYVQLGRPTIWNIKNWEKVFKRINLCENEIKYKKMVNKNKNINRNILNILKIFDKDCIFTGNLAYYTLLNNFTYGLEYLEILTRNPKKYVNQIKKKCSGLIEIEDIPSFLHLMKGGIKISLDKKPICYIWKLDDCSNYFVKKGNKYSSYYYLMFYFNLIKYFNKFYGYFQNWKISETILYKIYRKRKEYGKKQFECLGNINPGINELKTTFFQTGIKNIKNYKPSTNKLNDL